MSATRPDTVVQIDLAAFDRNLAAVRSRISPSQLMFVVKDDAYGHGAVMLAERAARAGVQWIGCLDVESAIALRPIVGPHVRLFAWLLSADDELHAAIEAKVDLGVGDVAVLDAVTSAASAVGTPALTHLKIDTGLNRNGVRPEHWDRFVMRARTGELAGALDVAGVWSHIAEASDEEDDRARQRFETAVGAARAAGLTPAVRHLAASAAGFMRPEFDYDLVRIGAFVYGVSPAGGPDERALGITPIMSLRTRVTEVRNHTAVIPIGAGHGIPSRAAHRATVSIRGVPRPVHRIGFDWMELEAGDATSHGDEAIVFGAGTDGDLTATGWAELIDTIGEEIVLRVDRKVPRDYINR
jgi:alanine racemase